MKKMYIAGKITGEPHRATVKKFVEAETTARKLGFNPVNPLDFIPAYTRVRVNDSEQIWRDAMKECLPRLLDCDAILLCHDFHNSRGAIAEHFLAIKMNIPRYYADATGKIFQHTDEYGKLKKAV